MMSAPDQLTLQTKSDAYSLQVSAIEDRRFWFRLEREEGRDVITDFFIGSTPEQGAGDLLTECYRVLKITPKPVIVFRDILPSIEPTEIDGDLTEARNFYNECGKTLLASLGARKVLGRLVNERGKYNLVLEVIREVGDDSSQGGRSRPL